MTVTSPRSLLRSNPETLTHTLFASAVSFVTFTGIAADKPLPKCAVVTVWSNADHDVVVDLLEKLKGRMFGEYAKHLPYRLVPENKVLRSPNFTKEAFEELKLIRSGSFLSRVKYGTAKGYLALKGYDPRSGIGKGGLLGRRKIQKWFQAVDDDVEYVMQVAVIFSPSSSGSLRGYTMSDKGWKEFSVSGKFPQTTRITLDVFNRDGRSKFDISERGRKKGSLEKALKEFAEELENEGKKARR